MAAAIVNQETLKSLFNYDAETGIFTRRVSTSSNAKADSVAGSLHKGHGYLQIRIQGKIYLSHRLAWLYIHGTFPPKCIDHINRVRTDNRLCNLRLATRVENMQNKSMYASNASGYVGVGWYKKSKKWHAQIQVTNNFIHLGYFTELTEAIAARKAAELKFHTFQNS